jgi:hypothetical protein
VVGWGHLGSLEPGPQLGGHLGSVDPEKQFNFDMEPSMFLFFILPGLHENGVVGLCVVD